jgi:hypothetical protein
VRRLNLALHHASGPPSPPSGPANPRQRPGKTPELSPKKARRWERGIAAFRAYILAFDLLTDRNVVYHLLLLTSVLLGLEWGFMSSAALLDVLTFSATLGDVINAVVIPARQLAMTAWLFVIVMTIFGTFSIEFFGPEHFEVRAYVAKTLF